MTENTPPSSVQAVPPFKPLIISAPFGNYIQPEGTTATLGTFTAARRGGIPNRVWRVLKTVRYYPRLKGWVNKIGLRNPGIDWLVAKVQSGKIDPSDKIVSIHGFSAADWYKLIDDIAAVKPMAVEMNMSCPNVGHINWPEDLFEKAVATGVPVIVKVPPVNYELLLEQAIAAGVRLLHCCNTLPVDAGGMSGRPLKPVALQCIRKVREQSYGKDVTILGGGGIYEPQDVDDYIDAGADFIAVGTKTMNPIFLFTHKTLGPILSQAEKRVGTE